MINNNASEARPTKITVISVKICILWSLTEYPFHKTSLLYNTNCRTFQATISIQGTMKAQLLAKEPLTVKNISLQEATPVNLIK